MNGLRNQGGGLNDRIFALNQEINELQKQRQVTDGKIQEILTRDSTLFERGRAIRRNIEEKQNKFFENQAISKVLDEEIKALKTQIDSGAQGLPRNQIDAVLSKIPKNELAAIYQNHLLPEDKSSIGSYFDTDAATLTLKCAAPEDYPGD